MKVPALSGDLVAFLRAGRRLEYNPAKCEARHSPAGGALKVELFPMDYQSTPVEEADSHYHEMAAIWCRR